MVAAAAQKCLPNAYVRMLRGFSSPVVRIVLVGWKAAGGVRTLRAVQRVALI